VVKNRTITVDPESSGRRLDVFLARVLSDLSRSQIRRLIDLNNVWVEGRLVKASHKTKGGEKILVHEPVALPAEPAPEDIPLSVLFEDEHLLVINKPAGLVVHPAAGNPSGTLVNAVLHRCKDLSGIGGVKRPGIVHRLDRDTSGVMVVAKNDGTHASLSKQFLAHTVEKTYVAFLFQKPGARALPKIGAFDTWFGRHPTHRKRFSSKVRSGKKAITAYRVIQRYQGEKWLVLKVEVLPKTGRTHQIRVHFADAGYPLLGDETYGGRVSRLLPAELVPDRQALHALRLSFIHPATRNKMTFEAPLAPDLLELEGNLLQASTRV
jgi:23S rRNA pseudouridine1911/1915/1917 synthase